MTIFEHSALGDQPSPRIPPTTKSPSVKGWTALLNVPGFWRGLAAGRDADTIAGGYLRVAAALEAGRDVAEMPEVVAWLARRRA